MGNITPKSKNFPPNNFPGRLQSRPPETTMQHVLGRHGKWLPPRQKLERSQKGPNEKNINHIKHGDRVSCPCSGLGARTKSPRSVGRLEQDRPVGDGADEPEQQRL